MIRSLRPLDWALLALVALLAALIGLLLGGAVHSPDWLPPPAPRESTLHTAPVHEAPMTSVQSLSNTWKTPLFSTNRSPDVAVRQAGAQAASSLTGLTLTGVIIDGSIRVALLKQSSGAALKMKPGDRLVNGWTLERLDPMQATFSLNGRSQVLSLPAPRLPPPLPPHPVTSTTDSAL
jgi:general secretion pathway protein N